MATTALKVLALTCSLRPSPAESSAELMAGQLLKAMEAHGASTSLIRIADRNVMPGVELDMGDGDDWPHIRAAMLEADILVLATPIWLGHMSSLAQRVLERLDAELAETDAQGRLKTYGKVGLVAVVGNEDGAHKVTADLFQALNDVGFSLPANASVYWVGEAMQKVDYKDHDQPPDKVAVSIKAAAANAVHLARLLETNQYPGQA